MEPCDGLACCPARCPARGGPTGDGVLAESGDGDLRDSSAQSSRELHRGRRVSDWYGAVWLQRKWHRAR